MHIVHKKMGVTVADALNMTGGLAVAGFFFEVKLLLLHKDRHNRKLTLQC